MSYRDIVVQTDRADARARYRIAAALAARGKGRLSGVYLKTSLMYQYASIDPIAWLPPDDLNAIVREHDVAQDEAADASGAALSAVARAVGVACDLDVLNGDTADDLVARARSADLLVVPPPSAAPAYNVHASAVEVGMAIGGPVLVVPETDAAETEIGARILVAWNGGREASRALRDALPLMRDGAAIELRMAHAGADGDPTARVRSWLEGSGLKVNAVAARHTDERVADWLKAEALRAGCDMIVMGLYGHTRMREFVLGGVSRGMLHEPPLPLLISH